MLDMMHDRKQINFRSDAEVFDAIEFIRRHSDPIPSVAGAIREAILEKKRAIERRLADREKRKVG